MTAALESSPSSSAPSRRRVTNPNGNPTLNLSPRCGARTRAGCPCQAPAIRGKLRCRRHGGCSTGPRTAAGLARVSAARTTHGRYGAAARAHNRWTITLQRRIRVGNAAALLFEKLPEAFQARLLGTAPELMLPPRPAAGLTEAEDRAVRRAEAAALAPWRVVIAEVRGQQGKKAEGKPHEPVGGVAGPGVAVNLEGKPHVPVGLTALLSPLDPVFGSSPREGGGDAVAPAVLERVAAGVIAREEPHAPVAGVAGVGAAVNLEGRPLVPVAPPAGLTRAERKRWKWEQRKARKPAAVGVP